MYAGVPCYKLAQLHEAIKHDLPPTPNGLYECWSIIIEVFKKQKLDPAYVMPVELPPVTATGLASVGTATTDVKGE